jgi:hypothetical protein
MFLTSPVIFVGSFAAGSENQAIGPKDSALLWQGRAFYAIVNKIIYRNIGI